jgi:hypothetical protein
MTESGVAEISPITQNSAPAELVAKGNAIFENVDLYRLLTLDEIEPSSL